MSSRRWKIGTRTSALARAQTDVVIRLLSAAHPSLEGRDICLMPIQASGDWRPGTGESMLADQGGTKGLFVKELEDALAHGEIDMAVHSMKDVPTYLPEGLVMAAMPERGSALDTLITQPGVTGLDALPLGTRLGTSSLRRRAQILAHRPDLEVVPLRGNVDTRLRKLQEGMVQATLLARAGLNRLGMPESLGIDLPETIMLPAVGQGALGIEIRAADHEAHALLAAINCPVTVACVTAERALLQVLDGSCHTPIGAWGQDIGQGRLRLDALVASPDGLRVERHSAESTHAQAETLGRDVGAALRARVPADFFSHS
ncbi:MAG: hydroxymethylbilane synthase [Alphaproteobacteria bacterium]|nr:MAG: hydroxymethylbilane synthase [Alphaproteobacteria bacterium]